jgi:hypothetical protein
MGDIPVLDCDGFPFHNDRDAHRIRVLVAALNPRPDAVDTILSSLDAALSFSARYREVWHEVESYDRLVRSFSPLEVEELRARQETFARDYGNRMPMPRELRRQHVRQAPSANMFAPPDGLGVQQDDSASLADPVSVDAPHLLNALASARVEAASELRELRDGLDHSRHAEWLRALHDAASLLVRAGQAKATW